MYHLLLLPIGGGEGSEVLVGIHDTREAALRDLESFPKRSEYALKVEEVSTRRQTDVTTPTADMTEMAEYNGKRFNQFKEEYMGTLISTHFSTGKKVHAGTIGSSVALCGGWMGYNSTSYRQYVQPDCLRCIKKLEA